MHEMAVAKDYLPFIFATAESNFSSLDVSNIDAAAMCKDIVDLEKETDKLKMVELLALFMQDFRKSILNLKAP